MDLKLIEDLLNKYYQGETSLEEERKLKEFFIQEIIPESLRQEQIKFKFYSNASKESIDINFEKKLLKDYSSKNKTIPLRQYNRTLLRIAASILLIFGTYFYINRTSSFKEKNVYGTSDNPELAYAETKKALLLISQKLNKGTKNLNKLSKLNEMQNLLTNKKTKS